MKLCLSSYIDGPQKILPPEGTPLCKPYRYVPSQKVGLNDDNFLEVRYGNGVKNDIVWSEILNRSS